MGKIRNTMLHGDKRTKLILWGIVLLIIVAIACAVMFVLTIQVIWIIMAMLCIGIIFLIGRSSSLSEIDAVEEQQIGSRQEASAEKAADRISAGPDNAKTESLESESTEPESAVPVTVEAEPTKTEENTNTETTFAEATAETKTTQIAKGKNSEPKRSENVIPEIEAQAEPKETDLLNKKEQKARKKELKKAEKARKRKEKQDRKEQKRLEKEKQKALQSKDREKDTESDDSKGTETKESDKKGATTTKEDAVQAGSKGKKSETDTDKDEKEPGPERKITDPNKIFENYDEKQLKKIMVSYKVKKVHSPILIDMCQSERIKQCPAYLWVDKGKAHFLVLEEHPRLFTRNVNSMLKISYEKGVVANPQEDYKAVRKSTVINSVFGKLIPTYYEEGMNRQVTSHKNLYVILPDIKLTCMSVKAAFELLHSEFVLPSQYGLSERTGVFVQEAYKQKILWQDGVLTTTEYKDKIKTILQSMVDSKISKDDFTSNIEQLVMKQIITRDYAKYYEEHWDKKSFK